MRFYGSIISTLAISALALSSCQTTTVSPMQLAKNPGAVTNESVCQTLMDMAKNGTKPSKFQNDLLVIAAQRGLTAPICIQLVQQRNAQAAAAVIGIAAGVGAVAYCSNHNCGGGYSNYGYNGYQGNCEHAWQMTADNRRCGNMSADVRYGGAGIR